MNYFHRVTVAVHWSLILIKAVSPDLKIPVLTCKSASLAMERVRFDYLFFFVLNFEIRI
jgi:hypothetical protein